LSSYHAIPSFYRKLLVDTLIGEAGGRLFPEWSPETSLETMSELNIGTAILSVSTPGTAFPCRQLQAQRSTKYVTRSAEPSCAASCG
jgi:hypothetical protein